MVDQQEIRTIIVDDEPGARRRIERLLKTENDFTIVAQAGNGREALALIKEKKPDLVFLDVEMPGMKGVEVVRNLPVDQTPVIVFVTAFDEYAVQAFELAALDYLMKPFDDERFEQTLRRAQHTLNSKTQTDLQGQLGTFLQAFQSGSNGDSSLKYIERIAVDDRGQLRIVPIEQIDCITASGNYVDLHVGKEKLLVREQMQKLEAKLPPKLFCRIHRSSIVRLEEIDRLIVNPGGDYAVRLRNDKVLKVSRNRWPELTQRLGIETSISEE